MRNSLLVILLIILIDIVGIAYGYYYYYGQLISSPLYLWLFIPDCPFYVMLFAAALLLTIFGFESKLLNYISAVGMMKYGIWTVSALLLFGDYFFSSPLWLLSSVLFLLHIGMFLEGPLLISKRLNKSHLAVGLLWFLLNDYFDYFYGYWDVAGEYVMGTHPILQPADRIPVMMILTIMLSILLCFLAYVLSWSDAWWPVRRQLDDVRKNFQKIRKSSRGRRKSTR